MADAWALHERQERPFPGRFFVYRSYLGDEPIEPRSRTANLGAYMLETTVISPALVDGSQELCDYEPYGGLWFSSDDAYAFMKSHPSKHGRRLARTDSDPFVRTIAEIERDELLARMAANLETEALAGRGTRKLNQLAGRTWLGMREQVCPVHEVPYVRALAKRSVNVITRNLRDGYTSQAQANQAGLDLDDRMAEMSRDLSGGWRDVGR